MPDISDLQLEGDDVTRLAFYHFTDYLDLLNRHVHAIRDIVKENHNQTIDKDYKNMDQRVLHYAHSMRVILFTAIFNKKNYYL